MLEWWSMPTRRIVLVVVVFLASLAWQTPSAHAGGAVNKLGRGAANLLTGWVEIPKRIAETSSVQGAMSGWTWGLLRGLGYGFVRSAAGLYELVTFPFPAPPDYEPVITPEYVFMDDAPPSSH